MKAKMYATYGNPLPRNVHLTICQPNAPYDDVVVDIPYKTFKNYIEEDIVELPDGTKAELNDILVEHGKAYFVGADYKHYPVDVFYPNGTKAGLLP